MIIYKFFSLLVFVLLCGCQTSLSKQFNVDEIPQDWIGQTPIALMSAKGNPSQVINNNGYQYIIYMTGDNITFGNNEGDTPTGTFNMVDGYPQAQPFGNHFCQQTYIVQNGIITNAKQQGNGCSNVSDKTPTIE